MASGASTAKCIVLLFYFIVSHLNFSVIGSGDGTFKEGGLSLQLVQLLFRHGDRNPIDPYPNDPYKNESFWPEGYGQLTKRGKMQHFQLGQYLRRRYDGYISRDYSPYEIMVQSSDVDRALMSASTNLAGLYPPVDPFSTWNENLTWQPIPIHSLANQLDNTLRLSAPCPRYDQLKSDFNNSEVMRAISRENQDLYEDLTKHSGRPIYDPQQVDYLYDVLYIESLYHKKIPDWAAAYLTSPRMRNLTAFSFKAITYTEEMRRLKGGPLVKQLIEHMSDRITGKMDVRRKLCMYSAHDTTVATLLNTLDIYNMLSPPYASLVLVELLKNDTSSQYVVRVSYKNSTEEAYELAIPGCAVLCPFEDFVRITKPIVPENWEYECMKGGFVEFLGGSYLGLLVGGIVLTVLILAVPVMTIIRNKRCDNAPPQYPYLHLQMDDEEA